MLEGHEWFRPIGHERHEERGAVSGEGGIATGPNVTADFTRSISGLP
jgi:hypothetical protein